MNRQEASRAAKVLDSSPAATWIGNRRSDDGARLIQKCMRCGAEQTLELPAAVVSAFEGGARGPAIASLVPSGFDEELFTWKRAFQLAHEGCAGNEAA